MSGGPLVAGIEIGGTKCIATLGRSPEDIVEQVRIDTGDPETTLGFLDSLLEGWHRDHGYAALGVASFGPLRLDLDAPDAGSIVSTPKPGWSGIDVLRRWQGFGIPVALEVDVVAAALAEQRWGAARGLDDFSYITVGTGIGVGPIIGGQPITGRGHCEFGHARVPRLRDDNWPGCCPFHGDCVEGLASGAAIRSRAGGVQPTDEWEGWPSVEHAIAMLLHNLFMATQPRRILVGGGVMEGRPALLPAIRKRLRASLAGYYTASEWDEELVMPPGLGERSGPLGSLALARRLLGD